MSNLPVPFGYQSWATEKIVHLERTGLLSPPGSGKTRIVIDALKIMGCFERMWSSPILVVCTGPAFATWIRQMPLWCPDVEQSDIHIVKGSLRNVMWDMAASEGGIYITNWTCFRIDADIIAGAHWGAIVGDEYHKVMLRHKNNKTFKAMQKVSRHTPVVVLASGSGLRKNPSSMWTLFRVLEPLSRVFSSYWRFVNTWCIVNQGAFGQEIAGPKNVGQFKKLMEQYLAYIPKEVVAGEFPEGRRNPVHVQMTPKQAKAYYELEEEMITLTHDKTQALIAKNVMHRLTIQRKLLCCPRIVGIDENGGGLDYILEQMEDNPHVVIFCPFRQGVEEVATALGEKGYLIFTLMGGIEPEELEFIVQSFRSEPRSVIVGTIAYAESYDLESCATTYMLGYDHKLDAMEQAEGRTQRVTSEHEFVTWNYLQYNGTCDEYFLMNLNEDKRNVRRVLQRPEGYINHLMQGAQHNERLKD